MVKKLFQFLPIYGIMYTERGVGMERMIDAGGRVTIPKTVRTQLDIKDNEFLELTVEDGAIVLRPKPKTIVDLRRATKVHIDQRKVQAIKDKYQKGDRVELINMESAAYLIPRGMKGTVTEVDDLGSVHVKWENGMEVAVLNIPGDAIEKVTK